MITAATKKKYTPDELLRLPDGERYELVNGELVEHTLSKMASHVTARVVFKLAEFCQAKDVGWLFSESNSYQCYADDPNRVRRPDVSFIRRDRMTLEEYQEEGHTLIPPDLAVEVVSPNDTVYEVHCKVQEYLTAEVRIVWVVNPLNKFVEVCRLQGPWQILRENDFLDGEDLLPGFRCRVGDLFTTPFEAAMS